jgi:hypothetical protein
MCKRYIKISKPQKDNNNFHKEYNACKHKKIGCNENYASTQASVPSAEKKAAAEI